MTNTSGMCEAERLAREFHRIYEEQAPAYGYETKVDTRNFDPSTPNGRLMISTCQKLIEQWQSKPAQGEVVAYFDPRPGVDWECRFLEPDEIEQEDNRKFYTVPLIANQPAPSELCSYHDRDTSACVTYSGQAPCDPSPAVQGEPKPTKVVVEITARGWSERVYDGDQVIAEQRHTMISRGESKGDGERGDWYDVLPDDMQLAEALDDLSFGPFDVAGALYEIDEEWS